MTMQGHNSGGSTLITFVEAIEELEERRREIAAMIAEKKAAARVAGFDVKVMNAILKERRLTFTEREEYAALLDIYRASLGMLNGTPLGDAARRRLSGYKPPEPDPWAASTPAAPETIDETLDIEDAREAGRQAAREGRKIIENPFVAGDPRRAAWDEGWCAETGSDGMEIPEAWRRTGKKRGRKPKNERPDGDDQGDGRDDGRRE